MDNREILILKNDRGGDLFASISLISSLSSRYKKNKIYLSNLNSGFSFLFKKSKLEYTNYDLTFINKLKIFYDLLVNDYQKVYILTPKKFYFFLPFFFRKIKFYAIVYDGKNNLRPSNFFRKYLYKYRIIYRYKKNIKNYRELQLELLDNDDIYDKKFSALNIPKINKELKNILPSNFLYFQFRYLFFTQLNWGLEEFNYLISEFHKKYEYVLFSSDLENNSISNSFNSYFKSNYSILDTENYLKKINLSNKKTFFLDNINALNLFLVLNESNMNVAKEGIVSHLSYFHQKKCHNLFNFDLKTKDDVYHQKISYSEWCKGMNLSFSFLNKDIIKSTKKIYKNI